MNIICSGLAAIPSIFSLPVLTTSGNSLSWLYIPVKGRCRTVLVDKSSKYPLSLSGLLEPEPTASNLFFPSTSIQVNASKSGLFCFAILPFSVAGE